MKNINISNIILVAEKAEKEKASLELQAERINKIARTCTTAEGREKWEARIKLKSLTQVFMIHLTRF